MCCSCDVLWERQSILEVEKLRMLPRDSNVVSGRVQVGIIATHKLEKNYFSILAMTIQKFSDGTF